MKEENWTAQIKLTKKQAEFLKTGSMAMTRGNKYYFLPFWFKQTDKKNVFEIYKLDYLPDELKQVIEWSREKTNPEKKDGVLKGKGLWQQCLDSDIYYEGKS